MQPSVISSLGRPAVHPFPARMAHGVVADALAGRPRGKILDPMVGSGAVIAAAKACGHAATGVDIDPLACLIARVWVTPVDHDAVRERADSVLCQAGNLAAGMALRDAYPKDADSETKAFTRYWFDRRNRTQLAALATAISRTRRPIIREALWCAFSRLIFSKQNSVSLALDLPHSRPHRAFSTAPATPFEKWFDAVERVISGTIARSERRKGPRARVVLGDARRLQFQDATFDMVVTSPPYLNAIDYMRASKFSLVWMGRGVGDLASIRARSIGTERGLYGDKRVEVFRQIPMLRSLLSRVPDRQRALGAKYALDLRATLQEVRRVLRRRGTALIVVGDNRIRGHFMRNSRVVEDVANAVGLRLVSRNTRKLPPNRRYLPPPSGEDSLGKRMAEEVLLAFSKP